MDLDDSTEQAWRGFQGRLADHVAAMEEDDLLLVEAESAGGEDGAAPYVQLCCWGEELVRFEAVSNHYLAAQHRLDTEQEDALVDLGFARPTHAPSEEPDEGSANFHLDAERAEADRLAVMAVRALREVYGVAHPAFLDADGLERDPEAPPLEEPGPKAAAEARAVYPDGGPDQLQRLVDQALTPVLGHPPVRDEDGDVPVWFGSTLVWVRVLDTPLIRLFSCVVDGVEDLERAAFEVSVLNRDTTYPTFVLSGRRVMASYHLPAWPFVREQLQQVLRRMLRDLDRVAGDLAVRVGGTRWGEDPPEEEADTAATPASDQGHATHPAMLTLLHLEAEAPGSVDAEMAAEIFGHDRELLVRLLEGAEDEEGDGTVRLLRQALRVCVERELGRRGDGATSRSPHPRRRGRRAPDPTLEEVDPDMWG